ncbi:MAG: response regulator [Cyanobacteria bacterium P01_H01_bin.15]
MKRILVLDDVPSQAELIGRFLDQAGYSVITANSADEALEKISGQRPDVVVTDLVMPEISGLQFCRKLKKNPETNKIPVIACTTKDREMDRNWAMKQGVSAYVTKPFNKEDLLSAVQSVV